MKKRIEKVIILGLTFVMCLVLLSGCGNKYNAVIYSDAKAWMKDDFLRKQPTYDSEILIDGIDFGNSVFPEESTFVVKEQSSFDEMFNEFPPEINFESEMLVIYIFTDIYNGFSCRIKKTKLENETLKIVLLHEMAQPNIWGGHPPSTSNPVQRCLVIKMDKVDSATVNIELQYE